MEQTTLKY